MFTVGGKKDQAKAKERLKSAGPKSAQKPLGPSARLAKLSMYADAPSADVAIEDFELYALDRMRVLKAIDDGMSRGKKPPEMELLIKAEVAKHLKTTDAIAGGAADDAACTKDEVSHFALRMAYCRTEELRRWFLLQECALFKHRFSQLQPFEKARFLELNDMDYRPIGAEAFGRVQANLAAVLHGMMRRDDADAILGQGASGFYSVPFEEVADLTRSRRVFVSAGQAYVPRDQLTSLVVTAFRSRLSKALSVASRRWAQHVAGEERERLAPVIASLSKRYLGREYGTKRDGQDGGAGDVVTLRDLPAAASESFPLCAKNLFDQVKKEHHLRHEGRRQLQLYLKGIGLSLEEAMLFWKTEFCKKITAEKFENEYAYAVRHAYGKEGKRVDYTPHTCMKCISANPGSGEHHGCPYNTFGEESLAAALGAMRVAPRAARDIVEKAKAHHYQLACAMTFEATHGTQIESGVQHPNQYFQESRKARGFGGEKENDGEGTGASPEKEPVTPGAVKPRGVQPAPVSA